MLEQSKTTSSKADPPNHPSRAEGAEGAEIPESAAPPETKTREKYLIVSSGRTEQSSELRTDSRYLGWIHSGSGTVYRFFEGRFQRMAVTTARRPSAKQYGVNYFIFSWVDVPPEENEQR